MLFSELESMLSGFVKFPLKNQIEIDFDKDSKLFRLSVPIYTDKKTIPHCVHTYVNARKEMIFRPHRTSFQFRQPNQVDLVQEIPFKWGFQPTLRKQIIEFRRLAKRCQEMIMEIADEERDSLASTS